MTVGIVTNEAIEQALDKALASAETWTSGARARREHANLEAWGRSNPIPSVAEWDATGCVHGPTPVAQWELVGTTPMGPIRRPDDPRITAVPSPDLVTDPLWLASRCVKAGMELDTEATARRIAALGWPRYLDDWWQGYGPSQRDYFAGWAKAMRRLDTPERIAEATARLEVKRAQSRPQV